MTQHTDAEFQALWREWTSVVYSWAFRRRLSPRLSKKNYVHLHHRLLSVMNRETQRDTDPSTCDLYARASDLARPWVTVESIQSAETTTLRNLAKQCRALEQRFLPQHLIPLRSVALLAILVLTMSGLLVALLTTDSGSISFQHMISEPLIGLWHRLSRQRYLVRNWEAPLLGLVRLVMLIGCWCFRTPTRF